jgi:DNA topoisomerase-1
LIKFGRKTKEHYLMTEKDDKPTGWRADFVDGQWAEEAALVKKPKAKAKAKTKAKAKAKTKVKAKAKPKAKTEAS